MNEIQDNDKYLTEHVDYGNRRLLFKDEKSVKEHLELFHHRRWLYKNESKLHQLSLCQSRAIKKIVEEPK